MLPTPSMSRLTALVHSSSSFDKTDPFLEYHEPAWLAVLVLITVLKRMTANTEVHREFRPKAGSS